MCKLRINLGCVCLRFANGAMVALDPEGVMPPPVAGLQGAESCLPAAGQILHQACHVTEYCVSLGFASNTEARSWRPPLCATVALNQACMNTMRAILMPSD